MLHKRNQIAICSREPNPHTKQQHQKLTFNFAEKFSFHLILASRKKIFPQMKLIPLF